MTQGKKQSFDSREWNWVSCFDWALNVISKASASTFVNLQYLQTSVSEQHTRLVRCLLVRHDLGVLDSVLSPHPKDKFQNLLRAWRFF